MIRDPSDGSVKPASPKIPYDSGLRKQDNESERERLRSEQSREWLENWKKSRGDQT